MRVKEITDNVWSVTDETGFELFSGTNAQCWRFVDTINKDPVNKAQDTSDWYFKKMADLHSGYDK